VSVEKMTDSRQYRGFPAAAEIGYQQAVTDGSVRQLQVSRDASKKFAAAARGRLADSVTDPEPITSRWATAL
jgi:hypothetical protein